MEVSTSCLASHLHCQQPPQACPPPCSPSSPKGILWPFPHWVPSVSMWPPPWPCGATSPSPQCLTRGPAVFREEDPAAPAPGMPVLRGVPSWFSSLLRASAGLGGVGPFLVLLSCHVPKKKAVGGGGAPSPPPAWPIPAATCSQEPWRLGLGSFPATEPAQAPKGPHGTHTGTILMASLPLITTRVWCWGGKGAAKKLPQGSLDNGTAGQVILAPVWAAAVGRSYPRSPAQAYGRKVASWAWPAGGQRPRSFLLPGMVPRRSHSGQGS